MGRWSTKIAGAALLALLAATPVSGAPAATPPVASFHITAQPQFVRPREALRRLAVAEQAFGRNRFCVIGLRQPPDGLQAWVLWPRRHRMILWQPNGEVVDDLIDSTRTLDLSRDVVDTENDLHGSSYKVTRAWVAGMQARCAADGEYFTLTVTRAPAP